MVSKSFPLALAGLVLVALGCGKGEAAATGATVPSASAAPVAATASTGTVTAAPQAVVSAAPSPGAGGCKHAACADNFFVDTSVPDDCAVGATCSLAVKLVAVGDFHVNDEYPYRFKADEGSGVDFGGTDAMGKGVFSKPAGDWRKSDAKTGVMTVKFTPRDKGEKTISGTFKMSVCSAQNCLLEQRQLSALVLAR